MSYRAATLRTRLRNAGCAVGSATRSPSSHRSRGRSRSPSRNWAPVLAGMASRPPSPARVLLRDDGVLENADAVDLQPHHVAGADLRDPPGCAGQDEVAGLQGHDRAAELPERRDPMD